MTICSNRCTRQRHCPQLVQGARMEKAIPKHYYTLAGDCPTLINPKSITHLTLSPPGCQHHPPASNLHCLNVPRAMRTGTFSTSYSPVPKLHPPKCPTYCACPPIPGSTGCRCHDAVLSTRQLYTLLLLRCLCSSRVYCGTTIAAGKR